jgi:hypothetical protein
LARSRSGAMIDAVPLEGLPMIELLAAASIASADAAPFNRNRACNAGMLHASGQPALLLRPQDWPTAKVRKLSELPRAKAEFAVMRLVDGCIVAAPAAYRVPEN